jgi:hypothetical protein
MSIYRRTINAVPAIILTLLVLIAVINRAAPRTLGVMHIMPACIDRGALDKVYFGFLDDWREQLRFIDNRFNGCRYFRSGEVIGVLFCDHSACRVHPADDDDDYWILAPQLLNGAAPTLSR